MLDANGLTRSSIIYPGQSLALPGAPALAVAGRRPRPPAQQSAVLDAEQAANARLIIGIGRQLGVSDRGIAIALATAMVESSMRNLDWGDRDSLGLFQQRPSTGWGTEARSRDAARATQAFYGGAGDPNGADHARPARHPRVGEHGLHARRRRPCRSRRTPTGTARGKRRRTSGSPRSAERRAGPRRVSRCGAGGPGAP